MTISNISSKATRLIVINFYIDGPRVEEIKIYQNHPGHTTNITAMPIDGNQSAAGASPEPMAWYFGILHWVTQYYLHYSNDDFGLTLILLRQGQIWKTAKT